MYFKDPNNPTNQIFNEDEVSTTWEPPTKIPETIGTSHKNTNQNTNQNSRKKSNKKNPKKSKDHKNSDYDLSD